MWLIEPRDLIATLGSFAIAPLWSLRRMGIVLTDEEEEAYVAVWRHIGWVVCCAKYTCRADLLVATTSGFPPIACSTTTQQSPELPSCSLATPLTSSPWTILMSITGRRVPTGSCRLSQRDHHAKRPSSIISDYPGSYSETAWPTDWLYRPLLERSTGG